MGVKGAWKQFRKDDICCQKELDPKTDLNGLKLAIDVWPWMEQSIRGSANYDNHAKKPYLSTLLTRITSLLSCGVKPVVVFDGDNIPKEKEREISLMPVSQLLGKKVSYAESQRRGNKKQFFGASSSGASEKDNPIVKECTELLELLKIPVVQSPGEAEAQCAWLEQQGFVDGTVSVDSDYFFFGGNNQYEMEFKSTYPKCKKFTLRSDRSRERVVDPLQEEDSSREKGANVLPEEDITEACHADRAITRTELINAAMLSGCDYDLKGLKKIGFVKALKIIQQFRESENSDDVVSEGPLDILIRFRKHCTDITAKKLPKRKPSRWQNLDITFPEHFPNLKIFNLYQNPWVNKSSSILPPNWAEMIPLIPKNDSPLKVFSETHMDWKPARLDVMLRRIQKQEEKREILRAKEAKAEKSRMEEKRGRYMRANSPAKRQKKITEFLSSKKNYLRPGIDVGEDENPSTSKRSISEDRSLSPYRTARKCPRLPELPVI